MRKEQLNVKSAKGKVKRNVMNAMGMPLFAVFIARELVAKTVQAAPAQAQHTIIITSPKNMATYAAMIVMEPGMRLAACVSAGAVKDVTNVTQGKWTVENVIPKENLNVTNAAAIKK